MRLEVYLGWRHNGQNIENGQNIDSSANYFLACAICWISLVATHEIKRHNYHKPKKIEWYKPKSVAKKKERIAWNTITG